MEAKELQNIVRAIIQAASMPVSLEELCEVFKDYKGVEAFHIQEAIEALLKAVEPVQELKRIAGGYRYHIRQEYIPWVRQSQGLEEIEQELLPKALIETLAIIAYKQPISRGEADLIRGKNTSWVVFQQLEERGWIRVVAFGGESKRAALYGTTLEFLEYFGLNSIEDLPNLEEEMAMEKLLQKNEIKALESLKEI